MKMPDLYDDWKSKFLLQRYEPTDPMSFYRDVFGDGFLQETGEEHYADGKPVAIAVELVVGDNGRFQKSKRYTICDDLDQLDELLSHENFIIISPISYIGKERTSSNARYFHGLAIDVDGVSTEQQMKDLLYQIDGNGPSHLIPQPTYIVNSGNGLHYYYLFERPVPAFENTAKELQVYKDRLTRMIWNRYVTDLHDKVQIESLFQGFRLVGGITKDGRRTVVFRTGEKISIDYLNQFVPDEFRVKHSTYYKELPLARAKELYPEWYQNRVIDGKPKGHWTTKPDLYYWWLERIKNEKSVGHRYFCIMCLAVYAKKAGITYKQLEADAMNLVELFDSITTEQDNHFTEDDVFEALEMYNDSYYTFPIDTIKRLSSIDIKRNKRNGRTRAAHVRYMNNQRDFKLSEGECTMGRPTVKRVVEEYMAAHPDATQYQVAKETGLSKNTVRKWWHEIFDEPIEVPDIATDVDDFVIEITPPKTPRIDSSVYAIAYPTADGLRYFHSDVQSEMVAMIKTYEDQNVPIIKLSESEYKQFQRLELYNKKLNEHGKQKDED